MKTLLTIYFIAAAMSVHTGDDIITGPGTGAPCTDSWYQSIEEILQTGDGLGHGPDIGTDEWKSAVEFQLGIRDRAGVPATNAEAWCTYVDRIVRSNQHAAAAYEPAGAAMSHQPPSHTCDRVKPDTIEAMICTDRELSVLDLWMSGVYAAASRKAATEDTSRLEAGQQLWVKGRNECMESADMRNCVLGKYRQRIAELQARYQLLPGNGPYSFICDGKPANAVAVTFFRTDPPTLIAEYGDSVSLMYLQPSGSGARYQGQNETFWEHHGEAMVTWGHGATPMHCIKGQ